MKLTKIKDEEDRRGKVVEFISNHQGCNVQALVKGLNDHISRVTIYNVLRSLEKVGAIRTQKDKPNSRDHKLFVAANNLLVSVPQQLHEFEKAYFKLLDKSKERIRKKDFSAIATELGIHSSEPSKWTESERVQYSKYEVNKMLESIGKTEVAVKEHFKSLQDKPYNADKSTTTEGRNHFISDMTQRQSSIKRYSVELQTKLDKLKSEATDIIASRCRNDVDNFEVCVLLFGALRIFYTMINIIFHCSTIIWPVIVHDGPTLQQLFSSTYTKIAGIQLELTKFVVFPKSNPKFPDSINFIMGQLLNPIMEYGNSQYTLYYTALNMQSEFESVIKCTSNLGKELEQYGYPGSSSFGLDTESSKKIDSYFEPLISVLKGVGGLIP